ncbi:hypothetical protein GBAR_LOCUS10074, partial [Geodia barretti]
MYAAHLPAPSLLRSLADARTALLLLMLSLLPFAGVCSTAAESVCSFGRLPFSCYTGCPPINCDSSVESCTGDCVSGCFCPRDLFQLGSQLCVEEQHCIDSSMHSINKLVRYSESSGTNFICMGVEVISGISPLTLVYCF